MSRSKPFKASPRSALRKTAAPARSRLRQKTRRKRLHGKSSSAILQAAKGSNGFSRLVEIMALLRAPNGCPWDREQDFDTIKPYTLEETYEVMEAIDARDWESLKEELGDLLFQVVFYAQIASEYGYFSIDDVTEAIVHKMITRHPHVFGDLSVKGSHDVVANWEAIKRHEKAKRRESLLDGVPPELPALVRASRISEKAARAGYDWPDRNMLWNKLDEEIGELEEAIYGKQGRPKVRASVKGPIKNEKPIVPAKRREHVEEEIGDVLFVVANIARRFHLSAEDALRKSNAKFYRRFRHIETAIESNGLQFKDVSLEQMEEFYQQARQAEGKTRVRK